MSLKSPQELQQMIEALERRVAKLETLVAALRGRSANTSGLRARKTVTD